MITDFEGRAWRQWVLITSIPLIRLGDDDRVLGLATGAMLDYEGHRFILSVEHAVSRGTTGWPIVLQQDGQGRLGFYRPKPLPILVSSKEVPQPCATWTSALRRYRTHSKRGTNTLHPRDSSTNVPTTSSRFMRWPNLIQLESSVSLVKYGTSVTVRHRLCPRWSSILV